MRERARSEEDKTQRSEDLLAAAEAIALERGGVRYVTIAEVTDRVGLHRTGVRRYYASKEELLLELAERGWRQWAEAVKARFSGLIGLAPKDLATVLASTIVTLPVFCDLLTHVAIRLEGDVDVERARRYKSSAFAASDEIVAELVRAGTLDVDRASQLSAAAGIMAGSLWQVAHPTPTLAGLYAQEPQWAHVALDFEPRLTRFLQAFAVGLSHEASAQTPA
ncbi:AcrR family transcriptional regulator [Leifsonia sp. AK011]|uniref:TetR family transcriptional regulator n=1 Tax=Leifsonia sp. AK011 TaxID=2723075 RepID=UPI0015CEF056|nr:TetR family transcriptional regulator [Leifsonia sp. AK011]NYF09218.1 AcrR family transcriptional regulator [Leifsonia sp. AK011]